MRLFSILTLIATLAAAAVAHAAPDLAGRRPNIILILTDDQGYGDLACHGNPVVQTPQLDQFHAASVRFTDFQVSPTCAPTRASLMTGRHEFKSGVTHTIQERERLSLQSTTIAQVLQKAGYVTGVFGKWHLGDEPAYQPGRRGFNEVFIHGAGGIGQTYPGSCGDAPGNTYVNPAILHNGKFERTQGYCTDVFFAQARRWMEDQRGHPFFAYITPNAPHEPLISPGPRYDRLYDGKRIGGKPLTARDVAFYAMISNIDENVGKLLAHVRELGLETNTLVIFMTDNGSTHTRLFSAGMRGGKNSPYQGGTRVPSFWRWPGTLPSGVDVPALTAHIDVFPTFAELAGAPIPDGVRPDGRSLLPLLRNPQAPWPDRYVFVHQGRWARGQAATAKYQNCAVRNTRFRFVNNAELYDLPSDPGETRNVIGEYPEVVDGFRKAYDRWWDEVLPLMVNEDAVGPKVNPFKALYWEQFGGGPE